MVLPERLQQVAVGDPGRIEHHLHHLRMAGAARTDLLIGRIGRDPARIAGRRRPHARQLPEHPLHAPETAHAEHGRLHPRRMRPLQRMTQDEVGLIGRQRLGPTRQSRLRRGQFIGLLQQHGANSAKTASSPIWRLQGRLPMGTSCSNQPLPSVRSRRFRPGCIRAQVEWTGGRVVEGARLERVYRGNSIEGSNPSLSATAIIISFIFNQLRVDLAIFPFGLARFCSPCVPLIMAKAAVASSR